MQYSVWATHQGTREEDAVGILIPNEPSANGLIGEACELTESIDPVLVEPRVEVLEPTTRAGAAALRIARQQNKRERETGQA